MKMLAFDMDGTLLDNNRNMPLENINYLNKLKSDGYIIAIVTGRTISSAYNRLNNTNCVNYIISDTGAKIFNLDKKEIIYNKSILNATEQSKNMNIFLMIPLKPTPEDSSFLWNAATMPVI